MSTTGAGPVFRRGEGLPYDPNSDRMFHRLSTTRSTTIVTDKQTTNQPFYLGRLTHYYANAGDSLPRRIACVHIDTRSVEGERTGVLESFQQLSINVFQVSSGRVVYAVTIDAAVQPDQLVAFLEDCYYESFIVSPAEGETLSLPTLIRKTLSDTTGVSDFDVEPDLHQLLFLSPTLSGLGIAYETVQFDEEMLLRLVYRVYDPIREGFTSVNFPPELNRGWDAIAAVGSFVSVLCGHQDYVENAAVISAVMAVAALTDLRLAQNSVLNNLSVVRDSIETFSRAQRRVLLGELSDRLAVLEMNLSQHVEAAADIGLWIPSLRVEDYHRSLVRSIRLVERSQLIGKSIARLTAISVAKAQALETLDVAVEEHRRRSWTLVAAFLSSIAIPVSLILAFFGVAAKEVNPKLSMFDLDQYLLVYAFAFGMVGLATAVVLIFWRYAHPLRRGSKDSG